MRTRLILAALALMSISFPASAIVGSGASATFCDPHATTLTKCAGEDCDTGRVSDNHGLGVSTMDKDQQNIVVCLKHKAGNLVWKASTGDGGGGSYTVYGTNTCDSTSGYHQAYTGVAVVPSVVWTYLNAVGGASVLCKAGSGFAPAGPINASGHLPVITWTTSAIGATSASYTQDEMPCAVCVK